MGLISWKIALIMVDRLSLSASLLVLPATPGVSVGATLKIILEFLVIFKFEIYYPTVLKYE